MSNLLAGVGALILVIGGMGLAVWRHHRQTTEGNKPASEPEPSAGTVAALVPSPVIAGSGIEPTAASVEELALPLPPTGGRTDRVAWENLWKLLRGESVTEQQRTLGRDGRFHNRSGMRYTIVHAGGACVIVRLETPGDTKVRRMVVCNNPPQVLSVVEERAPDADNVLRDGVITAAQARDTSVAGLDQFYGEELALIVAELGRSYCVGDLPES